MPESEPKPKLIELVGPGAGQGWKAVLKNGKPAVVHEIPVPAAEATAAVPRLQRLFDHRHPALSPVLAWGTDPNGVWVAVEPNEGTPLSSILSRGPLTPPAAATLGAAVLSGVAALHEAGIAMGGFGATAVRVTTNGEVRLAGHPAAAVRAAPSQSDLRADVRSCGMAVCAAFGVDPAGAPAPPNIAPGLVVTMRSMASGAMGPSADRAQGAFREMAAALLSPDRGMAAQSELATRAGGREVPPITPFLPPGTVPPEPRSSTPAGDEPAPSPAPVPFIAPRREESPVRQSASYEAPDRPLQTYPSIPAVTFPPPAVPAAPAAASAPPVAEPRPSPPPVPTWSEAPPRPAPVEAPAAPVEAPPTPELIEPAPVNTPYPPPPPAAMPEPEPAPEPVQAAPLVPEAPTREPEAPAPEPEPPRVPTWEPVTPPPAPAPVAPASPFSTSPPAPVSPFASTPPAAAQVTRPPAPAPTPVPSQATWTPVEAPVWKPGEAIPAEPLGSGFAVVEAPPRPPTNPPVNRGPIVAPARKPSVARPTSSPGGPSERPAWLLPAAVAVVIVILLGIVGVFVLNRPSNPVSQVRTSPTASGQATASPRTSPGASPTSTGGAPRAVPSFGPTSAEPIRSVQICTPASPCNIPGDPPETATSCTVTSCKVEVALYFTAVQKSVPISYTLKFFNRCTGQTIDLPGAGTTTPASGYIVAIPTDHLGVNIPAGVKSGALVAVTQQPSVAASAPLLIGGESC